MLCKGSKSHKHMHTPTYICGFCAHTSLHVDVDVHTQKKGKKGKGDMGYGTFKNISVGWIADYNDFFHFSHF